MTFMPPHTRWFRPVLFCFYLLAGSGSSTQMQPILLAGLRWAFFTSPCCEFAVAAALERSGVKVEGVFRLRMSSAGRFSATGAAAFRTTLPFCLPCCNLVLLAMCPRICGRWERRWSHRRARAERAWAAQHVSGSGVVEGRGRAGRAE